MLRLSQFLCWLQEVEEYAKSDIYTQNNLVTEW